MGLKERVLRDLYTQNPQLNMLARGQLPGINTSFAEFADPMPTNENSKTYAQDTRAWLAREQWRDYQDRFAPYEEELLDSVQGRELLDERLSKIKVNNRRAFDTSAANAGRMRSRYGIKQNSQQQQVNNTQNSLARATSEATANNLTRSHIQDRNMSVIAGGGAREAISTFGG